MSALILKLEANSWPIENVCSELCRVAGLMGIGVTTEVEGVTLIAFAGDNPKGLQIDYERQLATDKYFRSIARDIYFSNPEFPNGKGGNYKSWIIEPDGIGGEFRAVRENYDPTPVNPDDPFGDPDNVLYGDSPEALMQMIDEMEDAA